MKRVYDISRVPNMAWSDIVFDREYVACELAEYLLAQHGLQEFNGFDSGDLMNNLLYFRALNDEWTDRRSSGN